MMFLLLKLERVKELFAKKQEKILEKQGERQMRTFRQGDLLIRETEIRYLDLERSLRSSKKELLEVSGESSGHKHAIEGHVKRTQGSSTLLLLDKPTSLTHPQHQALEIPAGIYEVYRVREYNPERDLSVFD